MTRIWQVGTKAGRLLALGLALGLSLTACVTPPAPPPAPPPSTTKTLFDSDPRDAIVEINGEIRGQTPMQLTIPVNRKNHVRIFKQGYTPVEFTTGTPTLGPRVSELKPNGFIAFLTEQPFKPDAGPAPEFAGSGVARTRDPAYPIGLRPTDEPASASKPFKTALAPAPAPAQTARRGGFAVKLPELENAQAVEEAIARNRAETAAAHPALAAAATTPAPVAEPAPIAAASPARPAPPAPSAMPAPQPETASKWAPLPVTAVEPAPTPTPMDAAAREKLRERLGFPEPPARNASPAVPANLAARQGSGPPAAAPVNRETDWLFSSKAPPEARRINTPLALRDFVTVFYDTLQDEIHVGQGDNLQELYALLGLSDRDAVRGLQALRSMRRAHGRDREAFIQAMFSHFRP